MAYARTVEKRPARLEDVMEFLVANETVLRHGRFIVHLSQLNKALHEMHDTVQKLHIPILFIYDGAYSRQTDEAIGQLLEFSFVPAVGRMGPQFRVRGDFEDGIEKNASKILERLRERLDEKSLEVLTEMAEKFHQRMVALESVRN